MLCTIVRRTGLAQNAELSTPVFCAPRARPDRSAADRRARRAGQPGERAERGTAARARARAGPRTSAELGAARGDRRLAQGPFRPAAGADPRPQGADEADARRRATDRCSSAATGGCSISARRRCGRAPGSSLRDESVAASVDLRRGDERGAGRARHALPRRLAAERLDRLSGGPAGLGAEPWAADRIRSFPGRASPQAACKAVDLQAGDG